MRMPIPSAGGGLQRIQISPPGPRVERRLRQSLRPPSRLRRSPAAIDRIAALHRKDLAPRPPPWRIGPRLLLLMKIEERRYNLLQIAPVRRIVRLHKELA